MILVNPNVWYTTQNSTEVMGHFEVLAYNSTRLCDFDARIDTCRPLIAIKDKSMSRRVRYVI